MTPLPLELSTLLIAPQDIYSLSIVQQCISHPLFGERCCPKCSTTIPSETSYSEHLVEHHCPSCTLESLKKLLSELNSESELTFQSFHFMKIVISCHCSMS